MEVYYSVLIDFDWLENIFIIRIFRIYHIFNIMITIVLSENRRNVHQSYSLFQLKQIEKAWNPNWQSKVNEEWESYKSFIIS